MFRNKTCEEVLDMIRVQVEAKFNKIWEFNYNNLKPDKSYHLNYWVNLDGFKVYIDEPFWIAPIDLEYSFKGLCNVPYHKLLVKQQLLMLADRSANDTTDMQKYTNRVWNTTHEVYDYKYFTCAYMDYNYYNTGVNFITPNWSTQKSPHWAQSMNIGEIVNREINLYLPAIYKYVRKIGKQVIEDH